MSAFFCTMLDQFDQKSSSDYIYSGRNRRRHRYKRFLFKLANPHGVVHPDRSKPTYIFSFFHFFTYNCNIRFFCNMIFQNFIIIQLVHCICRRDDYIRFMSPLQKVQILIDCICGSAIPVSIIYSNRRCKHIQPTLLSSKIPPF